MSAPTKVLVVEDDPIATTLTVRFLDHLGCGTCSATTVAGAEEILRGEHVDVILSDLMLTGDVDPEMPTAYRAAAEIGDPGHPPVIVAVSGDALGSDPDAYTRLGFDGYLPKPIDFQALEALIKSVGAGGGDHFGQEVKVELGLTEAVRSQVAMHSFLNVMNILMGELQLFRLDIQQPDAIPETLEVASQVLMGVRVGSLSPELLDRLAQLGETFQRESAEAAAAADDDVREATDEVRANINSIMVVLAVRLGEFAGRENNGLNWERHSVANLQRNYDQFFQAVEKNSKGRYHIVANIAAQESSDYLVNVHIDSDEGETITMPPVLQDVMRDILANARKYTPPGGRISAGLIKKGDALRMVVEDEGIGIPDGEVDRVVTFGFRASNAQTRPTQGAGFGLTKAYDVTRQLGGRFFIDSEEGRGTRIGLFVPVPEEHQARG